MTDKNKSIRILIATPCYGGNLHYQYVVSLLQLTKYLDSVNIGYTVSFLGNESLITRARNIMVGKCLSDESFTHLMFIDADIQFSVRSVMKLVDANKDVSVGVYPAKSIHFGKLEKILNSGERPSGLKSLCLNYMMHYELDSSGKPYFDVDHKLMKVRCGTTGFMLIKKSVLEQMVDAYPDLQYRSEKTSRIHNIHHDKLYLLFDCLKDPETNDYLSEDYSFCYLWRKLGGDIWADMESKLSHWGNYQFQGDLNAYFNAGMIRFEE